MRVGCEDVRRLIPELAEGGPRPVGPVEMHLSSCPECAAELGSFRELLVELSALQEVTVDPPPGFADRVLERAPSAALEAAGGRAATLEAVVGPAAEADDATLAAIPGNGHRQRLLTRLVGSPRVHHAALSLGGAVVGATAIGLLWWRATRRSLPGAERRAAVAGA